MQLLFYANENDQNNARLETAIRSAVPGGTIERFTSLAGLRERMRRIVEPDSIMVLAAVDRKELLEMQAFREMLTEIYIILVLPDQHKSTIQLAHLLRPRFISQFKDDFSHLNQIIAKIIQTPHGSPPVPGSEAKPSSIAMGGHKGGRGTPSGPTL